MKMINTSKDTDTMKGLFFIVQGQQVNKAEPSYTNTVTGETGWLGGYDPASYSTKEWYCVLDRKSFNYIYCGHDYSKAVRSIRNTIVRHRGVARNYFKEVSMYTSDDYYDVHYLGRAELTPEKRLKKCEDGRCPRTSPIMRDLYKHIDRMYGHHFEEAVKSAEESAYLELNTKPVDRSRKIYNKARKHLNTMRNKEETPFRTHKETPVLTPRNTAKKDTKPLITKPVKRKIKVFRA